MFVSRDVSLEEILLKFFFYRQVVKNNFLEVINLLQAGVNPNKCHMSGNRTPLWWAIWKQNEDMVHLLLSYGANPNIISDRHGSPLLIAHQKGNQKIIKLLQGKSAKLARLEIVKKDFMSNFSFRQPSCY